MSEAVTFYQSNIKSKTMVHFQSSTSAQICDEETDVLSTLIGQQGDEEEEEDNVEVEMIYDSSDVEEYMLEVSNSESDGDSTKRQLSTQRARLFAAAAPTTLLLLPKLAVRHSLI